MTNINKEYNRMLNSLSKTTKEKEKNYHRARKLDEEITKNVRVGKKSNPAFHAVEGSVDTKTSENTSLIWRFRCMLQKFLERMF